MHLLTISRSWFCNDGTSLKSIHAYENCLPPLYFPTLLFPLVSLPGYLIVFFPTMCWSTASWIHAFAFPTTTSFFFKLTVYCSLSHNWHPEFHHIQIDRQTYALVRSTLQFYFSMTSKQHSELRYIQIDRYSKLQPFLYHTFFRITVHLSCPFLCYTFFH
jgi:hypothetical protein